MALFDNRNHLHKVLTNAGEATFIRTIRANRPDGLRKPYEYVLQLKRTQELYDRLKVLRQRAIGLQCQAACLEKKAVSKGVRLDFFLLAYRPGLCGKPEVGVNEEDWVALCHAVQDVLVEYLGEDAQVYAEPYVDDGKFQLRFETYIAYEELV